MKNLKASGSYYGEFCTQRFDTGAATDADSTPTATATKNGADDGSFSLTVTKIDTGRYKITGTVPAYTAGDIVQISVAATVNSVAGKGVVDEFVVVSGRPGTDDIPIEDAVLATSQPNYEPAKAGDAMTLTEAYDAAKTAAAAGAKMDIVDAPNATGLAAIADAFLKRDWTSVTGEATRSVLNALRPLLNKWTSASGAGGYVVKKEDDSTTAWTGTLTVDENGNISGMDHD